MPEGLATDLAPGIKCFLLYRAPIVELETLLSGVTLEVKTCWYVFCNSPAVLLIFNILLLLILIDGIVALVRKSDGASTGQELCETIMP